MFCLAGDEGLLPHPHVIVEPAPSGLVACALTSNLHRARDPGNVLLEPGGGDLPEQTVVVVSQSVSVAPRGERIGSLEASRLAEIRAGRVFQQSFLAR